MGQREFDLFRNAPRGYQDYAKQLYGIPEGDQTDCQYALIDKVPDDPNLPSDSELLVLTEVDFGTPIDRKVIDADFQSSDMNPDGPRTPESGGAYATVDIEDTLIKSRQGLSTFAEKLMEGKTVDPLSSHYGDIGIRAGGLRPGQEDAYVWKVSPFKKAVELSLAFPERYGEISIVRGEKREAANGKTTMAQIVKPTEVLKIEGERLKELQQEYRDVYYQQDFALTEQQKRARDELFESYLVDQISAQASKNRTAAQAQQDSERMRPQPQQQARPTPRS
jgi:hypothetical protein